MKKFLSLLLAACMFLSLAAMLTACGEHEHSPKDYWQNNDTHHWKDCDADTCSEELDKAEHSYEITAKNDTKHTWSCICGKAYMEDHDYGEAVVVSEPSKTAAGVTEYTCEKCEYKKTTYVQYQPKTTVNAGDAAGLLTLTGVTNYTLDIVGDYEVLGAGGAKTLAFNGNTIKDGTGNTAFYWSLEDSVSYQYYLYNNTTWRKETSTQITTRHQSRVLALQGLVFDIDFVDDLDYNEQGKYYEGRNIEAVVFTDIGGDVAQKNKTYDQVKVYFEDDKLVRIEFEKGNYSFAARITYGTADFTLPTV